MVWKAECGELNLAHITENKKKYKIKKLKETKRQCQVRPAQVQDLSVQMEPDHGGKDLWNRWVLSLEINN